VLNFSGISTEDQPRIVPGGRESTFGLFIIYVVTFHVVWAVWPFVIYPRLQGIGERTFRYAVANLTIRLAVWVAPVLLFLRWIDGVDPLGYLKLHPRIGKGVVIGLVLTALNLLGMCARFGLPHFSLERVTWNSMLGTSFLVGLIEEVPYRGFMLRKFTERYGFWRANAITSFLFVAVHLPGWIALHTFRLDTAATILIFGAVMAIVFRYSESLWATIVTHSGNDFLSFVLFRM
jgi:membrane protease YdiL (CAAX protease family)